MSESIQPAASSDQVISADANSIMSTYARVPKVLVRGSGTRVWDSEGKEYLDFLAGISVCSIGHCHPRISDAIASQAQTLMHVSNIFHNPLQSALAERLTRLTGMERAFLGNSGAEANECAFKIARKHGKRRGGEACHEIISFSGSFHGRTLATVTATAQPKYQAPFTPLPPGFVHCPLGVRAAFDAAFTKSTAAVIIEPVQGESGIQIVPSDFLRYLRTRCDETGALLILDEIQSGMGRTGKFLASEHAGIQGDIVTLAKAIASGVPMGVCLARGTAARTLEPGDHGSTFGGQPLACAAALATLDVLEDETLIQNAASIGGSFRSSLEKLMQRSHGRITEVRAIGLMIGIGLRDQESRPLMLGLLEKGFIVNACGDHTLRLLPPLSITQQECDQFVDTLSGLMGITS